jgi:hypothetical protein
VRSLHNIRVGEPDIDPGVPTHTPGIPEGNALGGFEGTPGFYYDPTTPVPNHPERRRGMGKATAERSTGVNAGARNPIDPSAPTLTPA